MRRRRGRGRCLPVFFWHRRRLCLTHGCVAFQFRRILSNQLPLVVHAPQRMVFPAGAVWLQGFAPTLHNDNLHAKSLFIAKLPGSIRLDLASSGSQGSHCGPRELAAVLPLFCRSPGHERAGRAG